MSEGRRGEQRGGGGDASSISQHDGTCAASISSMCQPSFRQSYAWTAAAPHLHGQHPLWAVGAQDAHAVTALGAECMQGSGHSICLFCRLAIADKAVGARDAVDHRAVAETLGRRPAVCRVAAAQCRQRCCKIQGPKG